jgi:hypothetical protein
MRFQVLTAASMKIRIFWDVLPWMSTDVSEVRAASIIALMGWTTRRLMFDPRQRRKDFSSNLCIQTGSEAHPASCTMGTRGSFPGAKARPGRDADHSPPSRMSRSHTSSPPSASVACSGTALSLIRSTVYVYMLIVWFWVVLLCGLVCG